MKRSILLIEKDLGKANKLRKILSKLDFHVYHNDTVAASISLMQSFLPDFVVCGTSDSQANEIIDLSQFLLNKSIPYVMVVPSGDNPRYEQIKRYKPKAIYTTEIDEFGIQFLLGTFDFDDQPADKETKVLSIKQGTLYRMIPYDDIKYLKADVNGVTIYTNNEDIVLSSSLKSMNSAVDPDRFIRIHRNYMVNLKKVTKYDAARSLVFIDDFSLPTGRVYKSQVSKRIKKMSSVKG